MPNANQNLENIYTSHQIGVNRFANSEAREFNATIDKTRFALTGLVFAISEDATGTATDTEQMRWDRFGRKVAKLRGGAISDAADALDGTLNGFVDHEAGFVATALQAAIPVKLNATAPSLDNDAIVNDTAYNGQTFGQMMGSLAAADITRIVTETRAGVNAGQSSTEVVRRIVGTRRNNYTDGTPTNTTRNNSTTVVRTLTNGVGNESRSQSLDSIDIGFGALALAALIKERYSAILDGATTQICGSLDGRVFAIGDGPYPPLHFNCRSTRIPVIFGQQLVSNRFAARDVGTRKFVERDFRKEARSAAGSKWKAMTEGQRKKAITARRAKWTRENIGSPTTRTDYQSWLKSQPAKFQDEVLGKTKGKLFRNRGLTMEQMVDKSGNPYSLKELETMHKGMFT